MIQSNKVRSDRQNLIYYYILNTYKLLFRPNQQSEKKTVYYYAPIFMKFAVQR